MSRDARGNLETAADVSSASTRIVYDSKGSVTKVIRPGVSLPSPAMKSTTPTTSTTHLTSWSD